MEIDENLRRDAINDIPNTIEIITQGNIFRVNPIAYLRKKTLMILQLTTLWEIIIATLFLILIDLVNSKDAQSNKKYIPLFIQICVYVVFLTLIALLNQQYLNPAITYSIILSTGYMIVLTGLYGLQHNCLWIVTIIYVIIVIIVSFIYLRQKKMIWLLSLLGIQLILVVCKLEGIIMTTWGEALIILILMQIIISVVGLSLVMFGVMQRFREVRFTLQSLGIVYMGLLLVGYSFDAAIIILKFAIGARMYIIGIPCACYHLLLIIFVTKYRDMICLYKANGFVSNLEQYQPNLSFPKIFKQKTLYKRSIYWYSFKKLQKDQVQVRETELVIKGKPLTTDCVICYSEQASLVWMPCGHRTVCQGCGSYLLQTRKLKCVLCKKMCGQIYHIRQQEFKSEEDEYIADYFYKIQVY